jgi:hypothetical protein
MYKAYEEGRADKNPSEGWYQGELGFFDFYIIPLARKLKECQVFGVSSEEFLSYATTNRQEWEAKGLDIVAGYVDKYRLSRADAVHDISSNVIYQPQKTESTRDGAFRAERMNL